MTNRSCISIFVLLILFASGAAFAQVTSPESYLGYKPGDDFKLATYEKLSGYLEMLESQSGRIKILDMGPTTEGRRMKYAVISSEENIRDLDRYKEISQKLSLSRGVSKEEAVQLSKEGKAVIWIDSGLHSSETSPPMHQFQLAYNLLTNEDEETNFILDNVILLLVQANPDGMTIVADWYMKNVGTPYEKSRIPYLYHKYAGHDNNRDSFMANLQETQNLNRAIGIEWCPELIYTQHESAPFPARIWLPPNPEPVNPNLHPLIQRWKNLIGSAMAQRFDAKDLPGAISRTAFDLWYPGYTDGPSVESHNIPSMLTETANYGYATPNYYTINDFPAAYRDLTVGTFYPSPWEGGWWRFADAVEYNLTASMAVLDAAAKYKTELLSYKYKMAADVIEQFSSEPPYGWIISADQYDQNTTMLMLDRFMNFGIEVYKSDEVFTHEGISYPAGSYIIPTSQPFGMYVKNLMEDQVYPDLRKYPHLWQGISRTLRWEGTPLAPYDGVGWTLPEQMGVKTHKMSTPLELDINSLTEAEYPVGKISGSGRQYIFSAAENISYKAVNLIFKNGGTVSRTQAETEFGGQNFPAASFVVRTQNISRNKLSEIAQETNITMVGAGSPGKTISLTKPRIGLYKSWSASMDEGWITYVFDTYNFDYTELTDAEIRAGDLKNRYDVIILPDQRASSIINGHRKGTMPPEYTGGIASEGVKNLKQFVSEGGSLICNKGSSDFAIDEFKLPVENILRSVPSDTFNCPGSILKVNYNTSSPLTYGMPENGIGYISRSAVFELKKKSDAKDGAEPIIIAEYPEDDLLISGWILGESKIQGKAAIVEAPFNKGRIVLFGFNVHNRAQSYTNFKLLFNAVFRK